MVGTTDPSTGKNRDELRMTRNFPEVNPVLIGNAPMQCSTWAKERGVERDEGFLAYAASASGRLRRLGYLLTGDADLAEDVTQETLIKIYMAWPRIKDKGRLNAYARTTMIREVHDWRRRRRLGSEIPVEEWKLDRAAQPATVEFEASSALLDAIRSLTPQQRITIVLRFYEDLTEREAAEAMGCSISSVKSATHRGMDALRRHYLAAEGQLRQEGVDSDPHR